MSTFEYVYTSLSLFTCLILFQLTLPPNSNTTKPMSVKLFWCDKRGEFADCAQNMATVATEFKLLPRSGSPLANTMSLVMQGYEFAVPIYANQSVSKFWFEVDDYNGNGTNMVKYDNDGKGYVLPQDVVIFNPYLSTQKYSPNAEVFLVAGVSTGSYFRDLLTIFFGQVRQEETPTSVKMFGSGNIISTAMPWNATLQLKADPLLKNPSEGYKLYSVRWTDVPNQLIVDSEAVVDGGLTYKDDFRSAANLGTFGGLKKVSSIHRIALA